MHEDERLVSVGRKAISGGYKGEVAHVMTRQEEQMEWGEGGLPVDWKDIPRWRHLRDADRVYLNQNIDDRMLWMPRVDIFEEDSNHMRVEVELPGVPREDVSVIVDRSDLTICALKPQTNREANGLHLLSERHFGRFFRHLKLPYLIDQKGVRAHLIDGILHIHLPSLHDPAVHIPIEDIRG